MPILIPALEVYGSNLALLFLLLAVRSSAFIGKKLKAYFAKRNQTIKHLPRTPIPTMTLKKTERRHPASFRDPAGSILSVQGRVLRGLSESGAQRYQAVKQSGFLDTLEASERLVKTTNVQYDSKNYVQFLEHEIIPFITYPYEWPFSLLKDAALFHLNLHREALNADVVLMDASAYNIQFRGVLPCFIDILSFKTYQTGELWKGHRQFCEQFLNPLLMMSLKGIPYHAWYRGTLEGISTDMMARCLPWRYYLSWRALTHIFLPTYYQQRPSQTTKHLKKLQQATIPKSVYRQLLTQLFRWIEGLTFPENWHSVWKDYTNYSPYDSEALVIKKTFVADFAAQNKFSMLWDLGCNTGEFSEIALHNGVKQVIGFDADLGALEQAVKRAKTKNLNFLPLYQDMANPSPSQGWLCLERASAITRGSPNGILALALIHHLVIGHHLPLAEVIEWLVSLAPTGIIEFIPKTDPSIRKMLALREDIFLEYSEEKFLTLLQEQAVIVKTTPISSDGRCLYWYQREDVL